MPGLIASDTSVAIVSLNNIMTMILDSSVYFIGHHDHQRYALCFLSGPEFEDFQGSFLDDGRSGINPRIEVCCELTHTVDLGPLPCPMVGTIVAESQNWVLIYAIGKFFLGLSG